MPTYYANPLTGNINNNGSVNAPWDTLANIFLNNKKLVAGDTIILMSGYHGIPNITGLNSNYITIQSATNQTPCVGALTVTNASYWIIDGLSVSRSLIPAKHPNLLVKTAGVTIATQTVQTCSYITIQNCSIYSQLNSSTWKATEWKNYNTPVAIYGTKCSFLNNHLFNGCGFLVGYHANETTVSGNLIENFAGDGFGNRAHKLTFTNNIVRNCHKVNANHNDLFQSWGNDGTIISNNIFVAWLPGNTFLSGFANGTPGAVSDFQGLGAFDGTFTNQIITNNEVYVDHPIGIWILNATNCTINNNFVRRCGKYTYFSAGRKPYALPSVSIQPSKSGASSKNNTITNNRAEAYYITQTGGIFTNNLIIGGNSTVKKSGTTQTNNLSTQTDIVDEDNLCYLDIYTEKISNPVPISLNASYVGVEIKWSSVENVEGYYVHYKEKQIAKLYNNSSSVIIPELEDLNVANYKVIPYQNTKKI
jgi:hypothetical protein